MNDVSPRRRALRATIWTSTVLVALVYGASPWVGVHWMSEIKPGGPFWYASCARGVIQVRRVSAGSAPEVSSLGLIRLWESRLPLSERVGFAFQFGWNSSRQYLWVPLWAPLLALLGMAWLTRRPRARPFQCRVCGYDLRGAKPGACPECGAARPAA